MKSPILNSPYFEPNRHLKADDRGLTEEVVNSRRPSSFYIPVIHSFSFRSKKVRANATITPPNETLSELRKWSDFGSRKIASHL